MEYNINSDSQKFLETTDNRIAPEGLRQCTNPIMSRHTPLPVRRKLRQEVNFGCPVCGTPILEFHHIVPYSEEKHFDPDRMIALCPTHHREATNEAFSRSELYQYKEDPYISDVVDYPFRPDAESPVVPLGSAYVELGSPGEYTLVQIHGEEIFRINYIDGRLEFDINFYDSDNELIATVTNNEWWANTNEYWDIEFQGHRLRLWNEFREIGLNATYDPEHSMMACKGRFLYNGEELRIHPKSVSYPEMQSSIHGGYYVIGAPENHEPRYDYPGATLNIQLENGIFAVGESEGFAFQF